VCFPQEIDLEELLPSTRNPTPEIDLEELLPSTVGAQPLVISHYTHTTHTHTHTRTHTHTHTQDTWDLEVGGSSNVEPAVPDTWDLSLEDVDTLVEPQALG
jgi:hypothetical protein